MSAQRSKQNGPVEDVYTLQDVDFRFTEEPVLLNVSFSIHPGDSIGVLGDNGVGKTTLLRLLTGELAPRSGRILFMGQDLHNADTRRIGYVPQIKPEASKGLPLLCEEFVALGLFARPDYAQLRRLQRRRYVLDALEELEVGDLAKKEYGALSGGQKQRLHIARALVGAPTVLLFDEPTVGVDETSRHRFYNLLERMHDERGLTMLMVTHDPTHIQEQWNRVFSVQAHRVTEVQRGKEAVRHV